MFNFFKKKKIWGIYSDHLYSGLSGILMKYCHKKLENSLPKRKYDNILEIGPGPHSHYQYIKHPFKKYYILEANEEVFKRYKKNKNIIAKFQVKKNLPFKRNYFDRIILSHVLEHVIEPSKFIEKLFSKLKKGGVLSITLPTDPGLMWRLGRLYNKFFINKNTIKISSGEYEYMNAIEHVNSIFNLYHIIKFKYQKNDNFLEEYIPNKINSFDLNLFYNLHIIKKK
jgi:SAM-dependent methyltransferase